jgi:long-chain fatty acid transport protein
MPPRQWLGVNSALGLWQGVNPPHAFGAASKAIEETQMQTRLSSAALLAGLLAATLPGRQAAASGFALREDSAVFGGYADAGAASSADSLATITDNPAGMTYFSGTQTAAGASLIDPSISLHNSSAGSRVLPGQTPFPIAGDPGQDPTVAKVIPSSYFLFSPTDRLRVGLGVTVPFGLITSYAADAQVRYQALYSQVEAYDFNPSLAYRVTDWMSVGGGVSVQKFKAKLTQAVDFGTLVPATLYQRGLIGAGQLSSMLAAGSGQLANDGRADLQGTSWGVGWDLGVIVEPLPGTKLGLSYRSAINQQIQGRANFIVPTQYRALVNAVGAFQDTQATADLSLPANAWAGITQEITPQLTLDLSYQWTEWSRFKAIRVDFLNVNQPPQIEAENYQDSSFVALGGSYKWDDQLTLRSGIAYDETPTTDASRDFRLPDSNRYWLSVGASYQLSDSITLSGSYTHLFFGGSNVAHSGEFDTITASTSASTEVVSLEASMNL